VIAGSIAPENRVGDMESMVAVECHLDGIQFRPNPVDHGTQSNGIRIGARHKKRTVRVAEIILWIND
jgi:hypothetical protein